MAIKSIIYKLITLTQNFTLDITWTNVDPILCHHMASPGHIELPDDTKPSPEPILN